MSQRKKEGPGEWGEHVTIQEEVREQGTAGTSTECGGKEKACMKNMVNGTHGPNSLLCNRIIRPFPLSGFTHFLPLGFGLGRVTCFD